jgi:hypothetical protein
MTAVTNLELARRYITALSSGVGAEDFSSFFAPDVVQEEFPNRLLPNGAVRDLQAMKQARVRGQSLLRSEEFKVLSAVASEDQVAMELSWRGTINSQQRSVPVWPGVAGAVCCVPRIPRRTYHQAEKLRLLRSVVGRIGPAVRRWRWI